MSENSQEIRETKLWIGDEWIYPDSIVPLQNPHTGETIANVGYASRSQAELAIEVAAQAFESFRHVPSHQRAGILYRLSELLNEHREEAARILCAEAAKSIRAARAEVERTIQTYRFSAEAAKSLHGETVPMDAAPRGENHIGYVQYVPMGVVTAITPFNFPFNLVAHKVGPALAAGNTIVLKPAEQTPLSALFLAKLLAEAGLPKGVLNVIPGSGQELGEKLASHEKVAFLTFTGSPRVGRLLRGQAGLRRMTLELGSNSPLLIDHGFHDEDLDLIVKETVAGSFSYNGQVCISIQRIYVHASLYEDFLQRLIAATRKLVVGDPFSESTDITALINETAVTRLRAWLENAVQGGAKVHTGGTFEGNVMLPTVLTDVPLGAELNCEEAFGPIITIQPFEFWKDAIEQANHSKYGLNAGVFTKDLERAFQAINELQAGAVLINETPTFRVDQMPYGGIKESGSGREGVRYAMLDMMETKFVSFRTNLYESN